jgi:HSP20 family molecular chaperone IbpA
MSGLREFAESATNAVLEQFGRGLSRVQERRPLPYDLLESDEAYLVVFDAPGVSRSDLQVRFLDGAVQVRVDRFRDFYEGFEMRIPGRGLSIDGEVDLPGDAAVDPDRATATLGEDGTLRVEIPKRTSDSASEVTVEDEPHAAEAEDGEDADAEDDADHDPDATHDGHEANDDHDDHDDENDA